MLDMNIGAAGHIVATFALALNAGCVSQGGALYHLSDREAVVATLEGVEFETLCMPRACSAVVVDSAVRRLREVGPPNLDRFPIAFYLTRSDLDSPNLVSRRVQLEGAPKWEAGGDTVRVAISIVGTSQGDMRQLVATVARPSLFLMHAYVNVRRLRDRWTVHSVRYEEG
jgi:hypothetical protein